MWTTAQKLLYRHINGVAPEPEKGVNNEDNVGQGSDSSRDSRQSPVCIGSVAVVPLAE